MNHHRYRVFGISIDSEIEIPGLLPNDENEPDVTIKYGYVPEKLKDENGNHRAFEAVGNDFILKRNNVARCRIQDGKYITIHPYHQAIPEEIRLLLLGPVFGGLFHQRGLIPIHGSAVSKKNIAVIFSGDSQVGKSSLAFALSKRGYTIIADDLALVDMFDKQLPFLQPGLPHIKLWKDVLEHFQQNENLENVTPDHEKYYKPLHPLATQEPVIINKIIFLNKKETPGFYFRQIFGAEKFNLLMQHTFRVHYLEEMYQIHNHFENLTRLANAFKAYLVERPESPLQIMELADFIINKVLEC